MSISCWTICTVISVALKPMRRQCVFKFELNWNSIEKRMIVQFIKVCNRCNNHRTPLLATPSFTVQCVLPCHYSDVIMSAMASQFTSLTIVYSTVYSGANQRKHQTSASLAFVRGIHRGPVNSPHKWPVTRKMFPFDDVIMPSIIIATGSVSRLGLVWKQHHQLTERIIKLLITSESINPYRWA